MGTPGEHRRVILRVAGICVHAGRVLLQRDERNAYWILPGGQCESSETTAETLRREMREEAGAAVEVGPLLWLVENFFEIHGGPVKEYGFYYQYSLTGDSTRFLGVDEFEGIEEFTPDRKPVKLHFKWFALSELADLDLKPGVLKRELSEWPAAPGAAFATKHLVHRDGE